MSDGTRHETRPLRYDDFGPLREIVRAEGYVMVRRPGCMPGLRTVKEWEALPILEPIELPRGGKVVNVAEYVKGLGHGK